MAAVSAMNWIMIDKKYESSDKSEKLGGSADVRLGRLPMDNIFHTNVILDHLILCYPLITHGLGIYHLAVDKGNYCDLYLLWGDSDSHTHIFQVNVMLPISFLPILPKDKDKDKDKDKIV